MAGNALQNTIMTIAMDIGTSYSGYALLIRDIKEGIHVCMEYGESEGTAMAYKAPTSVLLKSDGSLHAFGYDAHRAYLEEGDDTMMFFTNFKMTLYHQGTEGKDLDVDGAKVRSTKGKEHSALEIFAHVMTFFRDHSKEYIEDTTGNEVDPKKILWVVTVPAIWSYSAKFFMRKAAYKAGLVTEEDDDRLLIALEPEVAALHCRQLTIKQFTGLSTEGLKNKHVREFEYMQPGDKYCVIDCGGGTVDITAQELLADDGVKQLGRAYGDAYGGAKVDALFEELVEDIFSQQFIMNLRKSKPITYQQLMLDYEKNKRGYCNTEKRPRIVVTIPRDFHTAFDEYKGSGDSVAIAAEAYKVRTGNDVDFKSGFLRVNRPFLDDELYQPVIDGVVAAVEGFIQKYEEHDIRTFFIVGGFGKAVCKDVREFLLKKIPDAKIRVPMDAGLAVLKGAVLFGTDPSIIRERIAELTYGLRIAPLFRKGYHDAVKKVTVEGTAYCQDVFQALIREGQKVKYGDVQHHSFANVDKDSDSFTAVVYSTTEKLEGGKVIYIDQNCKRIGSITVDVTAFGNDAVRVQFRVGGTELRVTATNVRTNKKTVTTVEFSALT